MNYKGIDLNKSVIYRIVLMGLIVALTIVCFYGCGEEKEKSHTKKNIKAHTKMYGLTIDDAWYDDTDLKDVAGGLKNLKVRPTVRIVMSREKAPGEYVKLFQTVAKYADIMACPVDSSEMKNFKDKESYLKRFKDSYEKLSGYVSIWEVGNEINGTEWIKQNPELIVGKISSAVDFIKSKDKKIGLTLYCTDSPRKDMIDWMKKYILGKLAKSVDYCFVSYYEDDNDGYKPEWKSIFNELGEIFPSALLGIGECGNISEKATNESKIAMAKKYYGMPKYHERFIGEYFWWNWVEDCIPHENNKVYEAIKSYGR